MVNQNDQAQVELRRQSFVNIVAGQTCAITATSAEVKSARLNADFAAGTQLVVWERMINNAFFFVGTLDCLQINIETMVKNRKNLIDMVKNEPSFSNKLDYFSKITTQLNDKCATEGALASIADSTLVKVFHAAQMEDALQKPSADGMMTIGFDTQAFRGEFHQAGAASNTPWAVRDISFDEVKIADGEKISGTYRNFKFVYGFTRDKRFVLSVVAPSDNDYGSDPTIYQKITLTAKNSGTVWESTKITDEFAHKDSKPALASVQFIWSKEVSEKIMISLLKGERVRLSTQRTPDNISRKYDANFPNPEQEYLYLDTAFAQAIEYAFAPKISFKGD